MTTVTITHATPAGFCINSSKRNAEPQIAEMYAELEFDVLLGGGDEFFNPSKREDKKTSILFTVKRVPDSKNTKRSERNQKRRKIIRNLQYRSITVYH